MSEDELITTIRKIVREEVTEGYRQDRESTIKETLSRFGLDLTSDDDEISQSKTDKLIGRAARERGQLDGSIRFRYMSEGRYGRVMCNRADVMRIKNLRKFK
jgi:hypothetical protein